MTLANVTISNNSAWRGGGFANQSYAGTTASFDHCTIANNSASGEGYSLYAESSSVTNLHNTILTSPSPGYTCNFSLAAILNNLHFNLSIDNSCQLVNGVDNDIVNPNPMLNTLSSNGGLTQTIALQPGSPAIDAADPATSITLDQRGYFRPMDGDGNGSSISDMGAYEFGSLLLSPIGWLPLIKK